MDFIEIAFVCSAVLHMITLCKLHFHRKEVKSYSDRTAKLLQMLRALKDRPEERKKALSWQDKLSNRLQ